ncbi:hypothetical protein ABPG74_008576 [Tetrahymena malaccensis]
MILSRSFQKLTQKKLHQKSIYHYNSLLGRPIDSFAVNSLINFDIECIKLFHFDLAMPWSSSIFLASVGLRLGFELTKYIINKFPVKQKEERLIEKGINEVFLKDLQKDVQFYQLEQKESDKLKKFYSLNSLVSQGINSYFILSFYRALNHITQHSHQFEGFAQEKLFWMENIATYDPMFLFPISIMILNYSLLKNSSHPMLIHLRNDPNKLKMFNLAFFSGLFAVFFPANYLVGYAGLASTHLFIEALKKRQYKKKEQEILNKFCFPKDFIKKY